MLDGSKRVWASRSRLTTQAGPVMSPRADDDLMRVNTLRFEPRRCKEACGSGINISMVRDELGRLHMKLDKIRDDDAPILRKSPLTGVVVNQLVRSSFHSVQIGTKLNRAASARCYWLVRLLSTRPEKQRGRRQ